MHDYNLYIYIYIYIIWLINCRNLCGTTTYIILCGSLDQAKTKAWWSFLYWSRWSTIQSFSL